jgi:hypothetical protein
MELATLPWQIVLTHLLKHSCLHDPTEDAIHFSQIMVLLTGIFRKSQTGSYKSPFVIADTTWAGFFLVVMRLFYHLHIESVIGSMS